MVPDREAKVPGSRVPDRGRGRGGRWKEGRKVLSRGGKRGCQVGVRCQRWGWMGVGWKGWLKEVLGQGECQAEGRKEWATPGKREGDSKEERGRHIGRRGLAR